MLQQPFFRATASWTVTDRTGRGITRSATGISHQSPEDAERIAKADAKRLAEEATTGQTSERNYGYGDRLRVEPVIKRLGIPGTPGSAFISINGYGSEVLNAEQLMFVDVDLPPPPGIGFFQLLFGRKQVPLDLSSEALNRLTDVIATQPELRVRVYRTAAGLRYIFVHRPYDATAATTNALMKSLEADEKFILLCGVQKCFRARLTPKPWRCGIHADHPKFEDNSERPDPLYEKWRQDYDRAAASYATCRFIEEYGNGHSDPALQELIALHDQTTRSESSLPLA